MNIQINEDQLHVINEMISIRGLSISAESAIYEMLNDDISGIERMLTESKELKAMQNQTINLNETGRSKLYLVK